MKITTKNILTAICLTAGLTACQNQQEFQDVIYFTGTDKSPVLTYSLEEATNIGLSIRSSAKVSEEVKVTVQTNPQLVEQFNAANGTAYELLPDTLYTFDAKEAVIEQGKYISDPFYLNVHKVEDMDAAATYCLPVQMGKVNAGGLPVLESSRTVYMIIKKTIITQAAQLSGTYFWVDFTSNPERDLTALKELTMEARIFIDDYQNSNPYISTIMGCEENFLLRLGDVKIPKDFMQLAGGGYPVASTQAIGSEQWIHVAATYDGKRIALYINGVLDAYIDAPRGTINLMDGSPGSNKKKASFYIGTTSNSTSRALKGAISEARLWTRALTASELASNICAVKADAEGLLAYWKFNTAKSVDEPTIVADMTGHGYDAIGNTAITWKTGVRCP